MKFTVELKDLRAALAAVLPHASSSAEDDRLRRVRLWVGEVNLTVAATDTNTMGLAVVSVWGDDVDDQTDAGEPVTFDLRPDEVKKLLAVHRVRKVAGEEVEQSVLFDVQPDCVVASDVSGLFPGSESLTVPLAGDTDIFPDLPTYVGRQVHAAEAAATSYRAEPLGLSASALTKVATGARAYAAPPVLRLVESREGRYVGVVTIGDSFVGLVTTVDIRERIRRDDEASLDAWPGWLARLPDGRDDDAKDLDELLTDVREALSGVEVTTSGEDPNADAPDGSGDSAEAPDPDPPPGGKRRGRRSKRHLESL